MCRVLIASLLVLAFVGCGSGEPGSTADENCIFAFAGEKLCGGDG